MDRPDIVIVHSDPVSSSAIRDRLKAAGYEVADPLRTIEGIEQLQPSLALIEATAYLPNAHIDVPSILIADENADVPLDLPCPDGILTMPLRGKQLENCVALALRRTECNPEKLLVSGLRHYGLFMLNAEGIVSSWNPGAAAIHGYDAHQIVGKHFSVFYTEDDRKSGIPDTELKTAAAEGQADDTRWLLRSNGEKFWAEGMTTCVRDRRRTILGYAKIVRDATERRKLEVQLEKSNEELQRFAYTVSHDLQEPLRTVRSYAELLSRRYAGKLDGDADEFIHFMMDAAGRMTQLLKDLLAYSQAGRPDRTVLEPTSSANILQWAIMNVDRLVKESGATITYDPLPMVDADQTQLSQVLQNLIGNAIKYRGAEAPKIHVSAVRTGEMYEFSVTDNGMGIDPEHHERVFGVFKRLHGKEVPGTGIGLAICRKIVESHGGRIWVESELNKGATFKFTLPVHD
jgi:PAS domain S-box-containing protein